MYYYTTIQKSGNCKIDQKDQQGHFKLMSLQKKNVFQINLVPKIFCSSKNP